MANEDSDIQQIRELLQQQNELQKQSIDLLLNMRRTQLARFVISLIVIILPFATAAFVLPRYITNVIDTIDFTRVAQNTNTQ